MRCLSLLALATLAAAFPSPRAVSSARTVTSVKILGLAENPNSPTLDRDGGGGGLLGKQSIWTFCDTITTNSDGGSNGDMTSFTANTIAWTSPKLPATGPPVLSDTLGSEGQATLAIPFTAGEQAYNDAHDPSKQRYAIWPGSNIVPLSNGSGLLFPGVTMVDATSGSVVYNGVYNTLITLTLGVDGGGGGGGAPTVSRPLESLFKAPAVTYGSFSGVKAIDGWIYLFGTSTTGLRVARTLEGDIADTSKYVYFDGSSGSSNEWGSSDPDAAKDLFSAKMSSGDVWYSNHHQNFVMVYMNGWADSKFYMRLSTDGGLTNWGEETVLYESELPAEGNGIGQYNYAGHAHPEFDASGKTLVLSYTFNRGPYETKVVKVEFE